MRLALVVTALLVSVGCRKVETKKAEGAIDTAIESDTDTDSDTDSDTDTDTDADDDVDVEDTGLDGMLCDDLEPVQLQLSPDDSNSMASPVLARDTVLGSWKDVMHPPRKWEFFNYYQVDYDRPKKKEGVAVAAELLEDEDDPSRYSLQIGVTSPRLSNANREPMNLTFVVDTSCSMQGEAMQNMKESLRAISARLRGGDLVSMVTWSSTTDIRLQTHAVTGPQDPVLAEQIEALEPDGGTDLHKGLMTGYGLAQQGFSSSRINRLVLFSDGMANAGVTSIKKIAKEAEDNTGDGIYLVGVGTGKANAYNDQLMDQVTDAGRGASVYIGTPQQAWTTFYSDFVRIFDIAARDVRVVVDLPPGFELVRYSAEQAVVNGSPRDVEPQHLAPNSSMVFYQELRSTCSVPADLAVIDVTVLWNDRDTHMPMSVEASYPIGELAAGSTSRLRKGRAILDYAATLSAFYRGAAERFGKRDRAMRSISEAQEAWPDDADLAEMEGVLDAL